MDVGREVTLLVLTVVYSVLGIVLLFAAFKVFDWLTPMDLGGQIFREKNVAAALMAGAFLVSLAVIISAAIHG